MSTKQLHRYQGGRQRPENAKRSGTTKVPAPRREPVRRGVCRVCGRVKAAHRYPTVEGLLG